MKTILFVFLILLTVLLNSCKDNNTVLDAQNGESKQVKPDITPKSETDTAEGSINEIIEKLQGEWKEQEYPFRRAHFKDSTVMFVEEGIADKISFKEYRISDSCPYEVNNIKNLEPEDRVILIVPDRRCEKVSVVNDSLILSGFNVTTNKDYRIVYIKEGA